MDKRNFCQKLGTGFALFAVIDVVLIELNVAPMPLADHILTALIILLAASLIGSYYFKGK